jgi:hypothetical protein
MEDNFKNKELLLEDGNTYIVIKIIKIENKLYAYVINKNDTFEGKFIEIITEANEKYINPITDEETIELILNKIGEELI